MPHLSIASIALAAVVTVAAPFAIRPVLQRLGVMDVPSARSSHTRPTLRGGGIAPLSGIVTGGLVALVSMAARGEVLMPFALVLAAAVAMATLGLLEDLRGVRVPIRAAVQLLVGVVLCIGLMSFYDLSWPWLLVGGVGFAAYVNFANFMDGVNGISSLHGLVAGLAYAGLGYLAGEYWLIISGFLVAAAFIAFLPWNLIPPGMFLGDVGSYLLGGSLAAIAITAMASGLSPVAVLAPLAIYLTDTVTTLIRRAGRGEPIFASHRSHTYQRLTDTGLSHIGVASTVAALTAASSRLGLATSSGLIPSPVAIVVIAAILVGYLLLPRARGYKEPSASAKAGLVDIPAPPNTPARPDWSPRVWAMVGATGFIGSALVRHLEAEGVEVRRVKAPRLTLDINARSAMSVAEAAASAAETAALAQALRGADVVINAAGAATPDATATPELFGANALLPAVVAQAGALARSRRIIHLSSTAVQGNRDVLNSSLDVLPFSAYSISKALGERAFLTSQTTDPGATDLLVIRATSVQGSGRKTTETLRRVAQTRLASVAAPGTQPSVVSSLQGLVVFAHAVGAEASAQRAIQLQPWEGLSAFDVLRIAGGKPPTIIPRWLCRTILLGGRVASSLAPRLAGLVRRVEVMWFGQAQETAPDLADARRGDIRQVLTSGHTR